MSCSFPFSDQKIKTELAVLLGRSCEELSTSWREGFAPALAKSSRPRPRLFLLCNCLVADSVAVGFSHDR